MPDYLMATIGAVAMRVMPLPDWGQVTREADESENIYADVATQLRPRTSALRHLAFGARLDGASKDDLIAQENALRAELAKETNSLALRPRNATNTVTFKLLCNPTAVAAFSRTYDKGNVGIYQLELIAEPWGYGALETALDAVPVEGPALVPLGDLEGQGDPRLRLTVTPDSGTLIQFLCVALCTGGESVDDYVYQGEDSDLDDDWYDYSGNGNCAGGHAARLDSGDTTAWTALGTVVPAGGPPAGRYRVLARARATDGDEGYLAKRKQDSTARDPSTNARLNATALAWHDLGEWVHYGSSPLRLYGKSVSGGLYLDQVVLLPVDWGFVWYTDPDELTDGVTFGWLYDHKYTAGGPEVDATGRMQGHGLKVPRSDFDLFVLLEPAGSDPAPEAVLDGTYLTRWEMFW